MGGFFLSGLEFEEVKAMCSLPPRCTPGCAMSAASPQNEVGGLLQSLGHDIRQAFAPCAYSKSYSSRER